MPKSSKKLILSTSQLNRFGFRVLTSGVDLKEFRDNPIMLWMHHRAERGLKEEVLPLGYWDDITIEGDTITAVPFFDDNDEFAMSIYHKVENGTLRTCSSGVIPLEFSEDKKHLLPGQTRATVTKWKMGEASITDRGANPGSLAVALYDLDTNLINLSEESINTVIPLIKPSENMEMLKLSGPEVAMKLGLKSDATQEKVFEAIENLVKLNGEHTKTIEGLETKLADKEKAAIKLSVDTYVNQLEIDRKITAAQKATVSELALKDFEGVKKLYDGIPANPTVQAILGTKGSEGGNSKLTKLCAQSYDELFQSGGLAEVKLNAPDDYKRIYKDKFGKEPKNV